MPSHADGQRAGAPRRTSGWPRGQSPSSNRARPHPKKAGRRERRNLASAAAKEKPSIPPKVRSPKNLATGRAILPFCPGPAAREGAWRLGGRILPCLLHWELLSGRAIAPRARLPGCWPLLPTVVVVCPSAFSEHRRPWPFPLLVSAGRATPRSSALLPHPPPLPQPAGSQSQSAYPP